MIGLAGSHRVGKTTLMREFAKRHGMQVVETSVSTIFRDLGYDPAEEFDFATRLKIQTEVLSRVDDIYAKVDSKKGAITDRTPLDMIAYTLAEAIGDKVSDSEFVLMDRYIDDCYQVLNKRFSMVVIVQPGIEIKHEPGKAAPNKAYIEHLNALIIGCASNARMGVWHQKFKRGDTSLEDRLLGLEYVYKQNTVQKQHDLAEHVRIGGNIH